jgi:hypothetical protein
MPLTMVAACLGLSFGAGISLYGVVLWLGAFRAFGWVSDLPGSLDILASAPILVVVAGLAVIEFLADKRRRLDTLWDAAHIFVRGPGGALLVFMAMHESGWLVRLAAAFVGGALAFSTHSTKASIRFTANAIREPIANLLLSLGEDVTVVVIVYLALFVPIAALAVVGVACVAMAIYLPRVALAFFVALNRTLNGFLARTR